MMAYHLKRSSFLFCALIIKCVFVLLANGTNKIPSLRSGNGEMEKVATEFGRILLDEIRSLRIKIDSIEEKLQLQAIHPKGVNCLQPRDCADLRKCGFSTSGVYEVKIHGERSVSVYCDMDSAGTGWLVFQRRIDGVVNFERGWSDYETGFGNANGEFWLGNDLLHLLTSNRKYRLRVDLEDFDGIKHFAEYGTFFIGSPADKYRLNIAEYLGDAGDSFGNQNGTQFSTMDSDNDFSPDRHCAQIFYGGWWYKNCYSCYLNGRYRRDRESTYDGIHWNYFRGWLPLKSAQMKIAPVTLNYIQN